MEKGEKGRVCVTGGRGYIASWLIMRLLQQGYYVNTTIRSTPSTPGSHVDVRFLTGLPGASTRLRIFEADLDKPETFQAPIVGCTGVYHLAHSMNLDANESIETCIRRSVEGTLGILQACIDAKTVKRVVYASSMVTVVAHGKVLAVNNEECWSDEDYIRANLKGSEAYYLSKMETEKMALDFAHKNGLDLVTVIPPFVHGPFICPNLPLSVRMAMAMIFGYQELYPHLPYTPMVHIDDLIDALIFLSEHPNAKGRYICSAVEMTIDKMREFLSTRYPNFPIPKPDELKEIKRIDQYPRFSSQKLLDIGFKFKYGLEEMYDQAIESCKEKGLLYSS